jgi:hypothetical protein
LSGDPEAADPLVFDVLEVGLEVELCLPPAIEFGLSPSYRIGLEHFVFLRDPFVKPSFASFWFITHGSTPGFFVCSTVGWGWYDVKSCGALTRTSGGLPRLLRTVSDPTLFFCVHGLTEHRPVTP